MWQGGEARGEASGEAGGARRIAWRARRGDEAWWRAGRQGGVAMRGGEGRGGCEAGRGARQGGGRRGGVTIIN